MKIRQVYLVLFLPLLMLIGVFTLSSNTAFAVNATSTAVSNTIENATVNLFCRLKVGRDIYISSGSGVFISDRGVILTNAHVAQYFLLEGKKDKITTSCSVRTGSPAEEQYIASVLYFPAEWITENADEIPKEKPQGTGANDFSLLYVTGTTKGTLPEKFPTLPIDTALETIGQGEVTIGAYPAEELDYDGLRHSLAQVDASSVVTHVQSFDKKLLPDVLTLAPSTAGSLGSSGGPVISDTGDIIGIVTSRSVAKNDHKLRAITLSYIDRIIQSQTAFPLSSMLTSNFAIRAMITNFTITSEDIQILTNGILNKE